jgi:hypothetical protein
MSTNNPKTGVNMTGQIPESQLWTLQEPHRSAIERGLAWAAENPPAETDLESLLTKRDWHIAASCSPQNSQLTVKSRLHLAMKKLRSSLAVAS